MTKAYALATAIGLTMTMSDAQATIAVDSLPDVSAIYAHTPQLVSAGLPTAEQFAVLKTVGVDAVINLIPTDSEFDKAHPDVDAIRANDLDYYHVAFDFADPVNTMEHFIAVMQRLEATDQDVLVHCALNIRASGIVYLYNAIKVGHAEPLDMSPWGDAAAVFKRYPEFTAFFDPIVAHYNIELAN